jgi:dTDP-D-glucose 4,6-dehydratase
VDNTKFKSITGFADATPFEEGLKQTISFYSSLAKDKNLMDEIVIENWKK